MRRKCFLAAALLPLFTAATFAQSFDVVVLQEGSPKRGNIVETNKDYIGLEVTGVTSQIEVVNVKRVVFATAPSQLSSAQTSIAAGQLEDALEKLQQVDLGDVQSNIVAEEVKYYIAYCASKLALAGGGDKNTAAQLMGAFAKNTGTYHYYEANEIMGELAVSSGRPDAAANFFRKVGEAPWPDYKMKAAVLEGQALIAQEEYRDAYTKFQQVLDSSMNTPVATRMKEFATLGKAKCMAAAMKPEEGVKLAQQIIANGDSRDGELFARAYNALGFCHVMAKQPKDALLAYLHVDLMFYQDPSQHAEALYHLISLWKEVNETERALKARTLLKQRYPGSIWSSKAG